MFPANWKISSNLRKQEREIKAKVLINNVEYTTDNIISMKFDDSINTSENFTIGEVYAKRCEVQLQGVSGIKEGVVVKPYLGIVVDGVTKMIPQGVFTATGVTAKKGIVTLECYDYMMMLEDEYISKLTYPATVASIVNEICTTKKITFEGELSEITIPKDPTGYSYREIIGYIASLNGGNAKFDREGKLIVKKYEYFEEFEGGTIVGLQTIAGNGTPVDGGDLVYSISGKNYMTLELKNLYKVSGVACKFGDLANSRGNDTNNVVSFVNPLVEDASLDNIHNTLKTIEFTACDIKYRGNFLLDAGDIIRICDTNDVEYKVLVSSHTLNYAGGLNGEIKSIGEGKSSNDFKQNKFKQGKSLTEVSIKLGEIKSTVIEHDEELGELSSEITQTRDDLTLMFKNGYGEGITTVNADGIEVAHTQYGTTTKMKADGFYIVDSNGETIAYLSSKDQWSEVRADKVFAGNIENIYEGDANLYVDHSKTVVGDGTSDKPFNSYAKLAEHLAKGTIINKDINIYITTTGSEITEVLSLKGLKGIGKISVWYDKNCVQRNSGFNIELDDISNYIFFNGGRTGYNTNDGAILLDTGNGHGVKITDCNNVMFEYINMNCLNWGIISHRSNVMARRVDFCNTWCCFEAHGGLIHLEDCCGNAGSSNGGDAIRAYDGCVITYGHVTSGCYVPKGAIKQYNGGVWKLGTPTETASFRTIPPTPPTSNQQKDFSYSDYGYYSGLYNNWNSIGYKTIYQGDWGYGNNRGIFTFDNSAINSFLAGGTVVDGSTISLKRENAGGYSAAQDIYLCGTTHTAASGSAPPVTKSYGKIGSLAWGKSGTFTLPKAFVQDLKAGTIKSPMFYTSDGSNYIKFSAVCTLRLKVNK